MIYTLSFDIHVNPCKFLQELTIAMVPRDAQSHLTCVLWGFDFVLSENVRKHQVRELSGHQNDGLNWSNKHGSIHNIVNLLLYLRVFEAFLDVFFVEDFGFAPPCENIVRTTTDWWIIGCHWLENRFCNQEVFLEEAAKDSAKACAIFIGTWCCN